MSTGTKIPDLNKSNEEVFNRYKVASMWGGAPQKSSNGKKRPLKQLGEHHDGSFGVYMAHKIQKLRNQNASFASSAVAAVAEAAQASHQHQYKDHAAGNGISSVFEGVHVYVDGYTVPSKEEIRQLMLLHGGGFEHYETSRVTHIIATHLPASKVLQLKYALALYYMPLCISVVR